MNNTRKPAYLLLQDGTLFQGRSVGLDGTATGEIAFNTGMTGYQEIFTDPSYYGQILTMATAHIGNYGVKAEEVESTSVKIAGLIVKNFSQFHSRPGSSGSLFDYFKAEGKVAIADVDTRALVRHIRDFGAQNAIISTELTTREALQAELNKVPSMEGLELSSYVATRETYTLGDPAAPFRVAVLDLGIKRAILNNLTDRGCYLKVFPMNATKAEMDQFQPHGYFLSNGPGDPAAMPAVIATVKDIIHSGKPVFGICLGHQMVALASGLTTFKMHNGHRGINHPVKNLLTGKGEITSQNHGFCVSDESLANNPAVEVTHRHLNDNTIAGIRLKDRQVFSVQYHPEASPGPHDSRYLFDQFVTNLQNQPS
jgi:carbamoyl-phosphate synthase small subunit